MAADSESEDVHKSFCFSLSQVVVVYRNVIPAVIKYLMQRPLLVESETKPPAQKKSKASKKLKKVRKLCFLSEDLLKQVHFLPIHI